MMCENIDIFVKVVVGGNELNQFLWSSNIILKKIKENRYFQSIFLLNMNMASSTFLYNH